MAGCPSYDARFFDMIRAYLIQVFTLGHNRNAFWIYNHHNYNNTLTLSLGFLGQSSIELMLNSSCSRIISYLSFGALYFQKIKTRPVGHLCLDGLKKSSNENLSWVKIAKMCECLVWMRVKRLQRCGATYGLQTKQHFDFMCSDPGDRE